MCNIMSEKSDQKDLIERHASWFKRLKVIEAIGGLAVAPFAPLAAPVIGAFVTFEAVQYAVADQLAQHFRRQRLTHAH